MLRKQVPLSDGSYSFFSSKCFVCLFIFLACVASSSTGENSDGFGGGVNTSENGEVHTVRKKMMMKKKHNLSPQELDRMDPFRQQELPRANLRTRNIAESNSSYDVIIVGAGWSGVTAARRLNSMGISNIKIIEARDEIGGRSKTVMEEWEGENIPIDLGSQWVNGIDDNPIQTIVNEYDVPFAINRHSWRVSIIIHVLSNIQQRIFIG